MRNVPSLEASASASVAELNITTTAPPPSQSPPPNCNGRTCPWWPYSSSKDFKANTTLIIVVLLCVLICIIAFNAVTHLHCNRRRRRNSHENQTPKLAAEIPAVIYTDGVKMTGTEPECIICLSEFTTGEKIRVLEKCSHGFHLQCVQQWLKSHSSCPTCRANCSIGSESCSLP